MRKINEIIIHCTATMSGREVSVDELRKWHKARGWRDVGYHYIVHLDGSVSLGRPAIEIGAHCSGHNKESIGVVYVGGLDKGGKACDTRTAEQKKALRVLVRQIEREQAKVGNMITKISGHNEYANKACPCFDVKKEHYELNG